MQNISEREDNLNNKYNAYNNTNITEVTSIFEIPSEWHKIVTIMFFFCIIVVTVVGNTLVIVAVATTKRLRTVTNYFVLSLAVADWLVGVFVMPLAVTTFVVGSKELGHLLCDIWISSDVCLCTASILSLCAISIDRYLAITQPLTYSRRWRSKKLALIMILFVWLIAIVITCPPILFNWHEERHKQEDCGYSQNRVYVVYSSMGSFFLPLLVVLFVYGRISIVILSRHKSLQRLNNIPSNKVSVKSDEAENEIEESTDHEENRTRSTLRRSYCQTVSTTSNSMKVSSLRRENKAAQTMTIVVGGFIACWLPFFVAYLANPFLQPHTIPSVVTTCLVWLGWCNSAFNPFIYAFYNTDFRVAFWRITMRTIFAKCRRKKLKRNKTQKSILSRNASIAVSLRTSR